jgi:transposase-like protein
MRWCQQLAAQGSDSFFTPRRTRGGHVLTSEKTAECERRLSEGLSVAEVARLVGINESALRKALVNGRVRRQPMMPRHNSEADTKSERSRKDAEASEGMGTACTRADDRVAAAMGMAGHACARFECCDDVAFGGLLALCANGLLSGLNRHLSLPAGYYSALHLLILMGFMALARIKRPKGLRHIPPGELGRTLGLDRVPEVRTLREKIARLASGGDVLGWQRELSAQWMIADLEEAGYLYVDGHVQVYHGDKANLPRRYVSREKLCLRGTTDYWVNNALGLLFLWCPNPWLRAWARRFWKTSSPSSSNRCPDNPPKRSWRRTPANIVSS